MASNSAYRLDLVRYALVYPGLLVVPLGVLTMFRPQLGLLLLLAAALLGAILFVTFGGDTRYEQEMGSGYNSQQKIGSGYNPQQDAPDRLLSATTGRLLLFGIGLFVLAGIVFVFVYMMQ